jgi:hypothetical protein
MDNLLMQTSGENRFIGTLLWDLADVVTFGALEKDPKSRENINPH